MFRDSDNVALEIGDTVMTKTGDGCLYTIVEFVVYEIAIEAVCQDKLSRNFKSFQPRDLIKIS